MASISDSILKIIVNEFIQATGWFFDRNQPYFLSSGHQFYDSDGNKLSLKNGVFDVEYQGKMLKAKVIESVFVKDTYVDYSISKITSKIDTWKPLYLSMPFEEAKGQNYEMSGFTKAHHSNIHLAVNEKILDAFIHNDNGQNVEVFQLSEYSEFDKLGMSGSPVCIKKANTYFAIALLLKQSKHGNHTRMMAYVLNNLRSHNIIINSLRSQNIQTRKILYKNKLILQLPRYSFSLVPPESNRLLSRNYDISKEFLRQWGEFGIKNENKLQQLTVNVNFPYPIALKNKWTSFRERTSFLNIVQDSFKGQENLCRLIIDFTGSFNFNEVTEVKLSHQIGIVIGNTNRIYSKPFYDLIIEFDRNTDTDDLITSIYNIAEDILIDINLFNSTKRTKFVFNTYKSKRTFSILKVDYVLKHKLLFYGIKINKNQIRYIPISSILRSDFIKNYTLKALDELWEKFINDTIVFDEFQNIIPKGKNLNYHKNDLSNNVNTITVKDFDGIIKELKALKKLGGQIPIKKIHKQLNQLQDSSQLIFAITRKRPKTVKQRQSVCQLMGTKNYRINMFNFFDIHRMNDLRKFSFCMYIVTFEIIEK